MRPPDLAAGLLVALAVALVVVAGHGTGDSFGDRKLLWGEPAPGGQQPVHRGLYASGLETSEFAPCSPEHRGERWWLVADSAAWVRLPDGAAVSGADPERPWITARALVRVRGTVTGRGEHGHLGVYDREIRVTEVLEVAPPDSAACL